VVFIVSVPFPKVSVVLVVPGVAEVPGPVFPLVPEIPIIPAVPMDSLV
jgi:hypothetical protein